MLFRSKFSAKHVYLLSNGVPSSEAGYFFVKMADFFSGELVKCHVL